MRVLKRTGAFMLAAAMAMTTMLTGCGKKEAAGPEINVGMNLADEEWTVMNKITDEFTAKTGIKVNGIQIGHEDMESKMESLSTANQADIDIIAPDNMMLAGMVSKGLIKDLSEYENKIPQEIYKNLYEDFKVDGKLYYMPYRPNVKLEFYDEDKFKENGLTPPETWEDVLKVGKTFFDKEGIGRIAYMAKNGGATTVTLFELIRSYGGDPVVLNDEGSVAAFKILQDLWQYTSTEVTKTSYAQMNQMLADGTVYFGENWPFCAVVVVKDNGKKNVKAYVGPKGSKGYNKVLGGNVLAIAENTKHMDESMQFIEYIMSKEVQERFCSEMGWLPARSDAAGTAEDWQQEYLNVAFEALEYAEPRPILPYWSDVDKAINDAYQEIVVNQNQDIQGVLDAQHANIEAAKAASGQ